MRALVSFGILFVAVPPSGATDWTRFRGLNGQGVVEARLPRTFSNVSIRWRTPVGAGHSSPVVWDGRLYVPCAIGLDG